MGVIKPVLTALGREDIANVLDGVVANGDALANSIAALVTLIGGLFLRNAPSPKQEVEIKKLKQYI